MPSSPIGMIIQYLRKMGLRERGDVSDGQLLERFCMQREQAAFEALLRRHGAMVLGVCQRVLHTAQKEQQVRTITQDQPEELWRELQPLLDQELQRLPEKYRAPIVLCDLEGKTHKEAARLLGWP